MSFQLLLSQVVITILLSTSSTCRDIPSVEDLPKLNVKELCSGIDNVDDLITAIRSSLNSEDQILNTAKPKRQISSDLYTEFKPPKKTPDQAIHKNKIQITNSKTIEGNNKFQPHYTSLYSQSKTVARKPYDRNKIDLFDTKNRLLVLNKGLYLYTYPTYSSHGYSDLVLSPFDTNSKGVNYRYNPAVDYSYNLEGTEIIEAAFIVPEGYDQPLPAPAAPSTSYNLEVNDGTVTRHEFRKDNGEYAVSYTSADGSTRSERGTLVRGSSGQTVLVLSGSYSYTSPDGQRFRVDYTADERGYRAVTVPDNPPHLRSYHSD